MCICTQIKLPRVLANKWNCKLCRPVYCYLGNGNLFVLFRKKYVKRLQIQHTYGNDEADDDVVSEESALQITEAAISAGRVPTAPELREITAPEGAEVTVGGKACKRCGSKSHSRKAPKTAYSIQKTKRLVVAQIFPCHFGGLGTFYCCTFCFFIANFTTLQSYKTLCKILY